MTQTGRAVSARARVVIGRGRGGRPRLVEARTPAPFGVRLAAGEVHLLSTAASPLGGDDLDLDLCVTAGVDVVVRSVAATVALPGDGRPSRSRTRVRVADGATLRWMVEPLVAAAGCDHHAEATVCLGTGSRLAWLDEVVLGRHGEGPGALVSSLHVDRGGTPLLRHGIDTRLPGWDGPAVTAGARAVGLLLSVGWPGTGGGPPGASVGWPGTGGGPPGVSVGVLGGPAALDGDALLVTGLAPDHHELRRLLERHLPAPG